MKKVLLTLTICIMMVLSLGGTVFANDEDSNQNGENTSEQIQEVEQEQTDDSSKEDDETREDAEVSEEKTNEEPEDEGIDTQIEYKDDLKANAESDSGSNGGVFAVDGDFSEWSDIPHTQITNDTQNAENYKHKDYYVAMKVIDNKVYIHAYMNNETGFDNFTEQDANAFFTFALFFNNNTSSQFYTNNIILQDDLGVHFSSKPNGLDSGEYYNYAIGRTSKGDYYYSNDKEATIEQLEAKGYVAGRMFIKRTDNEKIEAEYVFDLNILADELGVDVNTISTIHFSSGPMGKQIVTTGTPTGVIGVIACVGIAAGSYYFIDKKRKLH